MSDFLTWLQGPAVQKQQAEADSARVDATAKQLALKRLLSQQTAQAKLTGTTDPSGITWDLPPGQAPSLMGNQQPQTGLLGGPQQFQTAGAQPADQQRLLMQAYPDLYGSAMAERSSMAPIISQLPQAEQPIAMLDPKGYAEAKEKSLIPSDQVKLIDGLRARIDALGGQNSPAAAPYITAMNKETANIPALQQAEEARHNKAQEALSGMDVQPDPGNPGAFVMINKATGDVRKIGDGLFSNLTAPQPGGAQPASAAAAQPSASSAPGPAATAATPQPAVGGAAPPAPPSPQQPEDFTAQLAPDVENRLSKVPQQFQGTIRAMLSGRMPPLQGTVLKDPVMGPMFRAAQMIDPSFDETKWTERNKAATDMASSQPNSFGGQRIAAQTLMGHAAGLLDAAADNNSTSALGNIGNAGDNMLVNQTPPGMPGNSAAKKAALNNFQLHKIGVAEEGTKIMSGSAGTDSAKADMEARFSPDADISSTIGSVGGLADMMRQRMQSQVDKYNGITGSNSTVEDWLGPQATNQYQALTGLAAAVKSGQKVAPADVKKALSTGGAPTVMQPPPIASRVVGQSYPTPKGDMVWTGKGWMKPRQ